MSPRRTWRRRNAVPGGGQGDKQGRLSCDRGGRLGALRGGPRDLLNPEEKASGVIRGVCVCLPSGATGQGGSQDNPVPVQVTKGREHTRLPDFDPGPFLALGLRVTQQQYSSARPALLLQA